MDRHLLDYLPPVLREVQAFQSINAANEPEIRQAWAALERLLANRFLEEADALGVAVWEKELGLRPKGTDSLLLRKARVKALWNQELPYSMAWLRQWLAGVCGPEGYTAQVENYTLRIALDYTHLPEASRMAQEIARMLPPVCPSNLCLSLSGYLHSEGNAALGAYTELSTGLEVWPQGTAGPESVGTLALGALTEQHFTLHIYQKEGEL